MPVVVLLLALPIYAKAQVAKLPTVGVLSTLSPDRPPVRGLRDGLQETGYVNGKNFRWVMSNGKDLIELRSVALGFVKNRFDVLVTTSTLETDIAQKATSEIPIVFVAVDDPLRRGFVKSHARPGTNMTGVARLRDIEASGKLLELFKELAPKLQSVTLLSDGRGSERFHAVQTSSIRRVAARLHIQLSETSVRNKEEALAIISGLGVGPHHGVLLNCSALFSDLKSIASRAKERGIPIQGCSGRSVIEDGTLFSYEADLYQIGRRGAWYVDRILKGAKPQDLPIESPRRYEFMINLKTANAIGLEIPPEVLQRADRVIE
jgi:putative ABC transport system substrate-binding protein